MVEYKTLTADQPAAPEQLGKFAEEGWELLQILLWGKEFLHYFKRERLDG